MKDVDPHTWKSHPRVRANSHTCSSTVDRLKAGPANVPEVIYFGNTQANYQFEDTSFKDTNVLYNNPYIKTQTFKDNVDSGLSGG